MFLGSKEERCGEICGIVSAISVFVICRYIYFYCGYVLRLCTGMHFIIASTFCCHALAKWQAVRQAGRQGQKQQQQSSIQPANQSSILTGWLAWHYSPHSLAMAKSKHLNILPKIIKNKRTFHKRVIKTAQIYANFYNLYVSSATLLLLILLRHGLLVVPFFFCFGISLHISFTIYDFFFL